MKLDPKPLLGPKGIEANIEHYQVLIANTKDCCQQYVQQLQYWLDQLENTK